MSLALRLGALFVLGSIAVGCAGAASPDDAAGSSDEQDWVVKSKFNQAFTIVQAIDYLPFQYKLDGCYARALYMSMELAAQGMESNEVFAFAQRGTVLQVGSVQWGYHVAPMLEVGSSANVLVHMVIDPALSKTALTQSQWLTAMGKGPGTPAAEAPTMLFVPGSDYAPYEAEHDLANHDKDTPNFAAMPAYKTSDIQSACGVMHAYIALEPGATADEIAAKQSKLLARTPDLLKALAGKAKLTADADYSAGACAKYTVSDN